MDMEFELYVLGRDYLMTEYTIVQLYVYIAVFICKYMEN